jgi:YfiH family protein
VRLIASGQLPLYGWPEFDGAGVRAAVTTRAGGLSQGRFASLNLGFHVGDEHDAVLANRERVAAAFGVSLDDCVFAEQVAGTTVTTVGSDARGRGARSRDTAIPATDALITTDPGTVLVAMAADCMLITLVDPDAHVLALVHAGWPGTTAGIIPKAVAAMAECGADPARTIVTIAPTVSGGAYQVGDDVARAARTALGERTPEVLRPDGTGRYLFDLPAAARIQLAVAGVPAHRIHSSGAVTGPGTPYFSHRFEGPTGRFAVMAQLTGEAAA